MFTRAVYVSGDTNDDDLLQTTEVWTFTCTSNIFVDTTNVAYASSTMPPLVSAPDEWTVTVIEPAVFDYYVWSDEEPAMATRMPVKPEFQI